MLVFAVPESVETVASIVIATVAVKLTPVTVARYWLPSGSPE